MIIKKYQLYQDRQDVSLTAYLLDTSSELSYSKRRPAIIINPGGAYIMLSDREAEPIAMKFASFGFQTFILRYSVFNGGTNVWPQITSELLPSRRPQGEFPAPLLELGKAMLLVRQHAEEWNIDANQIGICGFSAGGHNATLYASLWKENILTNALHVKADQLKPAFCIAGYPFVDWELQYLDEMDSDTQNAYRLMYLDYFGTADPSKEKMHECSSDYRVTEDTCPCFIWNTVTDNAVDPRHSVLLIKALTDHRVPCEYHLFAEGHHGLALADRSTLNQASDVNETVAQWIPLVKQWLKKIVHYEG